MVFSFFELGAKWCIWLLLPLELGLPLSSQWTDLLLSSHVFIVCCDITSPSLTNLGIPLIASSWFGSSHIFISEPITARETQGSKKSDWSLSIPGARVELAQLIQVCLQIQTLRLIIDSLLIKRTQSHNENNCLFLSETKTLANVFGERARNRTF